MDAEHPRPSMRRVTPAEIQGALTGARAVVLVDEQGTFWAVESADVRVLGDNTVGLATGTRVSLGSPAEATPEFSPDERQVASRLVGELERGGGESFSFTTDAQGRLLDASTVQTLQVDKVVTIARIIVLAQSPPSVPRPAPAPEPPAATPAPAVGQVTIEVEPASARITAIDQAGSERTIGAGTSELPPGEWQFRVEADGYRTCTTSSLDSCRPFDVNLMPGAGRHFAATSRLSVVAGENQRLRLTLSRAESSAGDPGAPLTARPVRLGRPIRLEGRMSLGVEVSPLADETIRTDLGTRSLRRGLEVTIALTNRGSQQVENELISRVDGTGSVLVRYEPVDGAPSEAVGAIGQQLVGSDFGYRTTATPGGIAARGACLDNNPVGLQNPAGLHVGIVTILCTAPRETDRVRFMFPRPRVPSRAVLEIRSCSGCPETGIAVDLGRQQPAPAAGR